MSIPASATFLFCAAVIFGAFTLAVPILIVLAIALGIFLFALYGFRSSKVDILLVLLLCNFMYWLCSGMLTGAISPTDFLQSAFYMGDGRVFIYYFPLVVLLVIPARQSYIPAIIKVIKVVAILSLVLLGVWSIGGVGAISGGAADNLHGFMRSHHASGAMFSIVAIVLIITAVERANRTRTLVLGMAALLPLFATASRSSLVALLAVALWYLLRQVSFKKLVSLVIAGSLLLSMMPIITPHMYERTAGLLSLTLIQDMVETAANSDWEPGEETEYTGIAHNVLTRVLYWVYAYERFSDSPLIGMGFGRWNDLRLQMRGVEGLIYPAVAGEKVLSVNSAHNSYFHLLAESGVIGLALLIIFWASLYKRLKRNEILFHQNDSLRSYYIACQALIIFAAAGAMFGHWLAAPAIGLPIMTIIGLGVALGKYTSIDTGEITLDNRNHYYKKNNTRTIYSK